MNTDSLRDLIQADLDGELSATERAELARLLLRDPEAMRMHHEFRMTDKLLREIPGAEPPPELRAAILAAPALSARPDDPGRRRFGLPRYRIAAAVLGGMLIVGIGFLLLDVHAPATDLQGSLAAAAPQDDWSIRADGVEVDASLRRDDQRLSLGLDVSSAIPCELIAHFDPAKTTFVGNSGAVQPVAANDRVRVPLATGSRVFALEFAGAAPIRLQLRAGGRLLAEERLSAGDP